VLRFILSAPLLLIIISPAVSFGFEYLQPLPKSPVIPEGNPQTKDKINLGKQLFFDPRLSVDGVISCNSCHNLADSGDTETSVINIANRQYNRNAPSLWNIGHMSTYYWDARAKSLEQQAEDHLLDPRVMAISDKAVLTKRINAIPGYQKSFEKVFGKNAVTFENITKAIAAFERTLNTPNSDFDLYIQGDKSKLNSAAKRGLTLFNDKGCLSCHFGVNFAGPAPGPALKMGDGFYEMFPNYRGTFYEKKYNFVEDLGRYHVTLDPSHKVMWRVPSLRNVMETAPYFHNGAIHDIHLAVRIMSEVQFHYEISDKEVSDIVEFLKTLTGKFPTISLPRLPSSEGKNALN